MPLELMAEMVGTEEIQLPQPGPQAKVGKVDRAAGFCYLI
jgi:hypothetical protein